MLSASDLDDSFVPKGLQNSGTESTSGSTMSYCALNPRAIGEDITVSSQMQGVISATLDKHEMAHIFMLLGS
jgi:hypothetical protein